MLQQSSLPLKVLLKTKNQHLFLNILKNNVKKICAKIFFISNKSINNLSSNPFEKIIKKTLNYYKKDNKK